MKGSNVNNCTVVVFHNTEENIQSTLDSLASQFDNVIVQTSKNHIIEALKNQQQYGTTCTLLLIDAESCNLRNDRECPDLLLNVVSLLEDKTLTNVVPIVCSECESPPFMVKCLQEGAADYLLKPLSEDVIKTLFLNVTRYKRNRSKKTLDHLNQVNRVSEPEDQHEENDTHSKGEVWLKFKERLKGVFHEHWLSKLVADYYTPKPSVRRSSMSSMLSDRKEFLKAQICSWEFLPLDLDFKDLVQIVFMILNQVLTTFDELEPLRVSDADLYHFIFDICNFYHGTNPYHNFKHAVDVLQANYYFLCKLGLLEPMCSDCELLSNNNSGTQNTQNHHDDGIPSIQKLMKPLDIFALLMASIGHDVGHPGVNNSFMINTSTPLAILYNDKSVLESFHAMSFYHLMQSNCFRKLTDLRANPEYSTFRKIVVNSILATDMSMHDEYVSKIKDQAERLRKNEIDFSDASVCEKEKILLCGALIKCADISNCARPFESAKRWAKILAEEFFEQGDLERELGMPVLPINQRGKIPLTDFQITFKRFIALKLFVAVTEVTPEMQFTVDQIHANVDIWESMKMDECKHLKQQQQQPQEQEQEQEQQQEHMEKDAVTPNNVPPEPSVED
ncbi:hypothetical protein BDF20DRAFT_882488 [Mycotypha africana]|uniref:uncharacterized protein n=1 Tax=Mycotypha africana TaxID=64632 RepID=UPI002301F6D5|nr:uncharacterized protein BDF20DRAFT_882488 [Mycotypha africana]KAI8973459.1 hypothetical protein BDF20DRAFT_882488 [Mycotypha africana]